MKVIFGAGIFYLLLVITAAVAWIQGIVLAFKASVVLGIICIFVELPFPIFALVYWFTGVDLAQRIVTAFPQFFG